MIKRKGKDRAVERRASTSGPPLPEKGLTDRLSSAAEKHAAEIQRRYAGGESPVALSKEFNLPLSVICVICEDTYVSSSRKLASRLVSPTARKAEIRQRYLNGETQAAIARELEVSRQMVSKICEGVLPLKERNAVIRRKGLDGQTVEELAEVYDLKPGEIKEILGEIKPEDWERYAEIQRRYAEGESSVDLAKEFELPLATVCTIAESTYTSQ